MVALGYAILLGITVIVIAVLSYRDIRKN